MKKREITLNTKKAIQNRIIPKYIIDYEQGCNSISLYQASIHIFICLLHNIFIVLFI